MNQTPRYRMFAWVAMLTVLVGGLRVRAADAPPQQPKQTWIFSGQSNMNAGSQFAAFEKVVEGAVPGLELSMVQSQRGGNPIQNWDEGGERWPEMLAAVKGAPSPITGMVWYQGEANARSGTHDYEQRLNTLIDRMRELTGNPELAVVVVQLASTRAEGWNTGMIREAQRRVAAADDHVAIVPAMDLPLGDAQIHITGDAHKEIGRREGLAALNMVFHARDLSDGPHFRRAYLMPGRDDTIVAEFETKGTAAEGIKLVDGWQQGFGLARGADLGEDMADWPAFDKVRPGVSDLEAPIRAAAVARNAIALRFAEPIQPGDRLNWGATAAGTMGRMRSWDTAITGVTDESGIVAPAFVMVKPADAPDDAGSLKLPDDWAAAAPLPPLADPAKPFAIAVNMIGTSGHTALDPDAQVGAGDYRQPYWNSAANISERPLFNSKGERMNVGVNIGAWYVKPTSASTDTPDGKIMAANSTAEPAVVFGLTPGEAYTLVVYADLPRGKENQGLMGYTVSDGGESRDTIYLQEPNSGGDGDKNYDFAGDYIEATKENDYTGNYFVIENVKADKDGKIEVRGRGKKDDEHSKVKPSISGLQIIRREASK